MRDVSWGGVWPTMVTPLLDSGELDEDSLARLVEWYIGHGVHGLFAVCQSSEMFLLSLTERVRLAQLVVELAAGRLPVIASGHVGDTLEEQLEEIGAIGATGIDAFVLVSNRIAEADDSDEALLERLESILTVFPAMRFGIYECPYPYKRLLSPEVLAWCAASGRILFLKDTCCDERLLAERLALTASSPLRIFNANTTTLLDSLRQGAAGFSGVMANFHPELYVRLTERFADPGVDAEGLQHYLTLASLIERADYPACAKYYLQREGVIAGHRTRVGDGQPLPGHTRLIVDQLRASDRRLRTGRSAR